MSDAPERIWIQSNHIPDSVALDKWDEEPDADEAHLFTGYLRVDHVTALIAAAYVDAANLHQSLWRETSAYKTDQILKRTPIDASQALDALLKAEQEKALREAARYLQSLCGCSQVTCASESDCDMDRQRARDILALIEKDATDG